MESELTYPNLLYDTPSALADRRRKSFPKSAWVHEEGVPSP